MEKENKNTLEQYISEYNTLLAEFIEHKEKIKCVELLIDSNGHKSTIECVYEGGEKIKQFDMVNVRGAINCVGLVLAVFETEKEKYKNLKSMEDEFGNMKVREYKTNRIEYFSELCDRNGKRSLFDVRRGFFIVVLDKDYDKPIDGLQECEASKKETQCIKVYVEDIGKTFDCIWRRDFELSPDNVGDKVDMNIKGMDYKGTIVDVYYVSEEEYENYIEYGQYFYMFI